MKLDFHPRCVAAFSIWDPDLVPDDITAVLGLTPTTIAESGQLVVPGGVHRRSEGQWRIAVELPGSGSGEEAIAQLIANLRPAWSQLLEVVGRYSTGISLSIEATSEQVSFGLDRSTMADILAVSGRLDIGVLYLDGTDDQFDNAV